MRGFFVKRKNKKIRNMVNLYIASTVLIKNKKEEIKIRNMVKSVVYVELYLYNLIARNVIFW